MEEANTGIFQNKINKTKIIIQKTIAMQKECFFFFIMYSIIMHSIQYE